MGFGDIRPALDTLYRLNIVEAIFLKVLQVFLDVSAGRTDDVYVYGEPMATTSQQNRRCGSAFPDVGPESESISTERTL